MIKIISGGQSGVDQAALQAARACGLETGGVAPAGWKTENGPRPSLAEFGLKESPSADYRVRTRSNIIASDGTLIIVGLTPDKGSQLTLDLCRRLRKHWFMVQNFMSPSPPAETKAVIEWMKENKISVLNVAGNRESKQSGINQKARQWLTELFDEYKKSTHGEQSHDSVQSHFHR